MTRPVAWLLLALAFSAPLLAQEDAAEGLERFLIESGDRCEIEPPEGGIDEKPVEVSAWRVTPPVDFSGLASPAFQVGWIASPGLALDPARDLGRLHRDAPSWVDPAIPRRHALLQHFLI